MSRIESPLIDKSNWINVCLSVVEKNEAVEVIGNKIVDKVCRIYESVFDKMCSAKERKSFRIDDILKSDKEKSKTFAPPVEYDKHNFDLHKKKESVIKFNESHKFYPSCAPANHKEVHRRQSVPNNGTQAYPLSPSWYAGGRYPDMSPVNNCNYGGLHTQNLQLPIKYYPPYSMGYHDYNFERGNLYNYWNSYFNYIPGLVKRKGGQVRFTSQQTNALESRFTSNKYLSPEDRRVLAAQLKLSDRQVKTWFQNRRAKWRRSPSDSGNTSGDEASKDDGEECDLDVDILEIKE